MTIEKDMHQVNVVEGPVVANAKTTATIFSTADLRRTPFLPSLVKTVNIAFAFGSASHPELKMGVDDRLSSVDKFFDTYGDSPESFIVIVSQPGSSETIATAGVRRYLGPPTDSDWPWFRRWEVEEDAQEWELKLMATQPSAQGAGIATFMVDLIEREVVRRYLANAATGEEAAAKKVRMVLATPLEVLGPFYSRRGYQRDYETPRGEPHNFHIVFMSKTLYTAS